MNNTKALGRKDLLNLIFAFSGFALLLMQILINPISYFTTAFMLILAGFILYFVSVFLAADKNWLDIRAVFTGVWLVTIGLAAFRVTDYQEQWQAMTWVWVSVAYLVFQLGATFGMAMGFRWDEGINKAFSKLHIGKLRFELKNNRLFIICLVGTVIGLVFFILNALVKGYVPAFSPDPHAYVNFYTRFQIFAVAGTGVSGLCYYTIRTQDIGKAKKVIMYLCILYNTFLYPIFVASRGSFLASAISVMVAVFYLHDKKFIALLLSLAVMFSVYYGCSYLRHYTDEQLVAFFEPKDNITEQDPPIDTEIDDDTAEEEAPGVSLSLPPKVVWLYSYLTVSHDNFNEAVENIENYTYGTRQFTPLNTVFRFDFIEKANENAEHHLVRPHLNTTNFIGDFFYDFGGFGVTLCTLLWSFLFGLNQALYEKTKNWIYLGLLGNTLVPIVLCFFATWTSVFSQWMLWGVILLSAIAAGVTLKSKKA